MKKLYTINNERFIAYNHYISKRKNAPCVIFLHGLMSDMEGSKALAIEEHCIKQGYSHIRFDNFGCGNSSSKFYKENVTTWSEGLDLVIDKLASDNILLVGSSMGGWISLLGAIYNPSKIIGLVCLAPAPDCTENLIWNKLPVQQQNMMQVKGLLRVKGGNPDCSIEYPISYDLILDGRKHMLLNKEKIKIDIPVHLIHGMQDIDVPYDISMAIANKLISRNVVLKLIKEADHRLSRYQDIKIITSSIDEILDVC